jgi:hypothetical protein
MTPGFGSEYKRLIMHILVTVAGMITGISIAFLVICIYLTVVNHTQGIDDCTYKNGVMIRSQYNQLVCIDKNMLKKVE